MRKRVLVTGATGFIGGHLVPYLYEKGLEIWASFRRRTREFYFPVRWIKADLTRFDEVLDLIRVSRPHYLFHLAAQASPKEAWKNPTQTLQSNVTASIHLLEAVFRFAPQSRVVLVSSAQVYGRTFYGRDCVGEKRLTNPMTPYAGSKLLMEMAGLNFVAHQKLSVVIARAFNQLGLGQNPNYVFSDFCRQIALIEKERAEPVLHVGNVDVVRDFLHVEDAVRAYYLLAQRGKRGEIYNVGSGKGVSLKKAIGFLAKEAHVPFKIKAVSSRFQKNDLSSAIVDVSKLRKLGWCPQRSIWDGLRELLNEWREKIR